MAYVQILFYCFCSQDQTAGKKHQLKTRMTWTPAAQASKPRFYEGYYLI